MIDEAKFFLKNCFIEQKVQLSLNGQTIEIETIKEKYEECKKIKKKLSAYSDFSILTITAKQDKNESLNLARDIKNLLSIALGQRVIFDKQSYFKNNNHSIVFQEMIDSTNFGIQIIPHFEIQNFLNKTLLKWIELTEEEKKIFYIVTDYLNQTREDYLEDRILRTMQAWECFANFWTKPAELNKDLEELKKRIKKIFKDWKKVYDYNDLHGILFNNLNIALHQEQLISRLENFITECDFNCQKINLKLKELKKMRDLVVHEGIMNKSGDQAIDILEPAIKALQIILLKKLGYDGLVIDSENNSRVLNTIEHYFK